MAYLINTHAKGYFYESNLLADTFHEMNGGTDLGDAVSLAKWIFKHPKVQYVTVWDCDENDEFTIFYEKFKLGFWLGMQYIGMVNWAEFWNAEFLRERGKLPEPTDEIDVQILAAQRKHYKGVK
jgi:hypothetical protein